MHVNAQDKNFDRECLNVILTLDGNLPVDYIS